MSGSPPIDNDDPILPLDAKANGDAPINPIPPAAPATDNAGFDASRLMEGVAEIRDTAANGGGFARPRKPPLSARPTILPECDAQQVALDLIARGIAPVPVPVGKSPKLTKWQLLRITEAEVPKYFGKPGTNVGAIMGPASGDLTDVDLDCREAVALASEFLPTTHAKYGRASKQRSHYLYTCHDPEPKAFIKLQDDKARVIVEIRMGGGGKGAQSVWPGSVHPSGEFYEWDEDGERREVKYAELKAAVVKIAVGALLVRHWPDYGGRHDAALTLGGFLSRAGWDADEVESFVFTISLAGGSQTPDAHGKTARDSAERYAAGGQVFGMPTMSKIFGEHVARKIADHLGYKGAVAEPPKNPDGLPVVQYGALSKMADRAAEILLEAKVPFYQRGNRLVRPVVLPVNTFGGQPASAAQLFEVDIHYLRDTLCQKSQWVKFDLRSHSWVDIHPPPDAAMVLLKRFGDWKFPAVAGIISTPTLRPDGTILKNAGYDPATQLLLIDPPPMPEIPDNPTRNDALAALGLLKDLLAEFPFVDEVSLAVALSAQISTVCRGAYPIVPVHVVDAPVAGSGKSYLLSTVSWIATGQAMPVLGAGRSEEELGKRLDAAVITGQPLICIDNVVGEIGGEAICRLTEQWRPQVRILGQTQLVNVDARGISFFANGNNIIVLGDFCRRVVRCRLDPCREHPELRQFERNPMKEILEHRGTYIAAALTICRAYRAAGRPGLLPQLASYGEWSDTVRSALVWLEEADPVKSMDTSKAEDPETNALLIMLSEWKAVFGTGEKNRVPLRDVINRCDANVMIFNGKDYIHKGLRNAVLSVMPVQHHLKPDATALGCWLRSRKDRRAGRMWFNKQDATGHTPTMWWVEEVGDGGT
jgi:Bifunctional DNA primase/polymerase, N-terminal